MNSASNELHRHYELLLGIGSPWTVSQVKLELDNKRVEIILEWVSGQKAICPVCQQPCGIYDFASERTWRHLDTMQFETLIRARVPRGECPEHGVKTVEVPWAAPRGRFTCLFERFAIDVLLACQTVAQAAELLKLSWDEVHHIMERAVDRGLLRRQASEIRLLGIDEKSFKKGHSYVTILTDWDESRVVEVAPERTQEAAEEVWKSLNEEQKKSVKAVAMDMWEPYMEATAKQSPDACIVHDKFHISKYLNEAVDKVRRAEHKEMMAQGDERLKGSRQLWLYNPENFSQEQKADFEELKKLELKVSKAWAMKETFTNFWEYSYAGAARRFFTEWRQWVKKSKIKPMMEVAEKLNRHLENMLTYLKYPITNSFTEGINSKIQLLKASARGFRNFKNYRTRILFFCGKLQLYPQ